MRNVSIISVNYNGFAVTCEMIESLRKADFQGEIVIVDNGSAVDESILIREKYPDVIAIRSDQNLGFAGGNNLGIKKAAGDYLFFLNNDTTVVPGFVESLVNRIESSPEIGVVCPKIKFEYSPERIQFAGYTSLNNLTLRNRMIGFNEVDQGQYDMATETAFAMGAAMLVKRDVILTAGLMPECYFLYYEELDWCSRIKEGGYTVWYEPGATIYHKESASTGRTSPLKQYYLTRNRLIYARRNLKGLSGYLSALYQLTVALIKSLDFLTLKRRSDLALATIRGVIHGVKHFIT